MDIPPDAPDKVGHIAAGFAAIGTFFLGILGFSMKRNIKDIDNRISGNSRGISDLSGKVSIIDKDYISRGEFERHMREHRETIKDGFSDIRADVKGVHSRIDQILSERK